MAVRRPREGARRAPSPNLSTPFRGGRVNAGRTLGAGPQAVGSGAAHLVPTACRARVWPRGMVMIVVRADRTVRSSCKASL
jgi:hypothetical protein